MAIPVPIDVVLLIQFDKVRRLSFRLHSVLVWSKETLRCPTLVATTKNDFMNASPRELLDFNVHFCLKILCWLHERASETAMGEKKTMFGPNDQAAIVVRVALLAVACWLAWDIRLLAVKNYGRVIHEFDPWFNFRATEYLVANGWKKFSTWFDTLVWWVPSLLAINRDLLSVHSRALLNLWMYLEWEAEINANTTSWMLMLRFPASK